MTSSGELASLRRWRPCRERYSVTQFGGTILRPVLLAKTLSINALAHRRTFAEECAYQASLSLRRPPDAQTPAMLRGVIFAPGGRAMTPSHSRKNGRLYRYYVSTDAIRQGYSACLVRSVPAAEVEEAVVAQVRRLLQTPEIIARTWAAAKNELEMPEREVVKTITDFAPLWDELCPAEQARIVRRIDLAPDGAQVRLRAEGLQTLVEELRSREVKAA